MRGRLDVLAHVAAGEPVERRALADELDQTPALAPARRPQLAVVELIDATPFLGLREPTVDVGGPQQIAHLGAHPRRHVHTVGDVPDRDRLDGVPGPQRRSTSSARRRRGGADPVGGAAQPQRRLRHPELLLRFVRVRAAERDQLRVVEAELGHHARERVRTCSLGYASLPAGDRRVSREHDPLARRCDPAVAGAQLERRECRVTLVQVQHARIDSERAQRPRATDSEQHVLREPRVGIAVVQPRRDPPLERRVGGEVGVEQEQRHAADVDPPDPRGRDDAFGDRHVDRRGALRTRQ